MKHVMTDMLQFVVAEGNFSAIIEHDKSVQKFGTRTLS